MELLRLTLPAGLPKGTWLYEAALISPELGRTLARDAKSFTITGATAPTMSAAMPVADLILTGCTICKAGDTFSVDVTIKNPTTNPTTSL